MSDDGADTVPEWVLDRITDEGALDLSGEDLGGKIPAWVCQLTDLRGLNLANCHLTGPIPPELGRLTNLNRLRLDGNQLSGPIPPELGRLTDLTVLRLDPAQTDGELPRALQQLVTRSTSQPDDAIAEMIAAGESNTVEFKSTLRVNLKTGKPDKDLEHAVLKNIAAFLNTDGGTLIIGVDDQGNPLGLDGDAFLDNEDKLARYLSNLVSDRLGAGVWGNIDIEFASYQGRRILVIRCTQSSTPILVGEDDEFYARIGPTTRRLTPREMVDYVRIRF